jgi:hypothetical protein
MYLKKKKMTMKTMKLSAGLRTAWLALPLPWDIRLDDGPIEIDVVVPLYHHSRLKTFNYIEENTTSNVPEKFVI